MISNIIPIRLDWDNIKWLDEYATANGLIYRGKPNRSAVIKRCIKQARQTESVHPPPTTEDETQFWKDFPKYVECREQGLSHLETAKNLGLLRLPPEVERAYEKRYMDMAKSEANFVLLILGQYLDESEMKRLTMLTHNDPMKFIVERVRAYIKLATAYFKVILENPRLHPEMVEDARLFLLQT